MKFKFHWEENSGVQAASRQVLPAFAEEFFRAGTATVKPETPAGELHQFRLAAKRFRYTLELFRPAYGPALDTMIASLRKVQGFLGDINDCEATRRLVLRTASKRSPHVRQLLRHLDERQASRLAGLQQYWDTHFAPQAQSRRWTGYLRRK